MAGNVSSLIVNSNVSDSFILSVKDRITEIITAPNNVKDMIWILAPIIITLLLMEFYFSRYSDEELGWNTAFGNSLVLVFVAIDLTRRLYETTFFQIDTKAAIILAIVLEGIMLTFINFFHLLPKQLAFKISYKLPINFTAIIAVILVYTNIPIDIITGIAFFILLIGIVLLSGVVHVLMPKVREKLDEIPKPIYDDGINGS